MQLNTIVENIVKTNLLNFDDIQFQQHGSESVDKSVHKVISTEYIRNVQLHDAVCLTPDGKYFIMPKKKVYTTSSWHLKELGIQIIGRCVATRDKFEDDMPRFVVDKNYILQYFEPFWITDHRSGFIWQRMPHHLNGITNGDEAEADIHGYENSQELYEYANESCSFRKIMDHNKDFYIPAIGELYRADIENSGRYFPSYSHPVSSTLFDAGLAWCIHDGSSISRIGIQQSCRYIPFLYVNPAKVDTNGSKFLGESVNNLLSMNSEVSFEETNLSNQVNNTTKDNILKLRLKMIEFNQPLYFDKVRQKYIITNESTANDNGYKVVGHCAGEAKYFSDEMPRFIANCVISGIILGKAQFAIRKFDGVYLTDDEDDAPNDDFGYENTDVLEQQSDHTGIIHKLKVYDDNYYIPSFGELYVAILHNVEHLHTQESLLTSTLFDNRHLWINEYVSWSQSYGWGTVGIFNECNVQPFIHVTEKNTIFEG